MVGPPPVAKSVARARTSNASPVRMSSISTPASSPAVRRWNEVERTVILDAAHIAPPDLLGQAIDDFDPGQIAFMHGAVESLTGERFLMHGAVGIAVEETAEFGFQFADALGAVLTSSQARS